nr:ATP-binding protein [Cystobacter ferrugineus]
MSHELVHARLLEHLERLRHLAERLDALLVEATWRVHLPGLPRCAAARGDGAKQSKRVSMGIITIAHFPAVKTLEDFDFKAQPSVDQKLVRRGAVVSVFRGARSCAPYVPLQRGFRGYQGGLHGTRRDDDPRKIKAVAGNCASCLRFPTALPRVRSPARAFAAPCSRRCARGMAWTCSSAW